MAQRKAGSCCDCSDTRDGLKRVRAVLGKLGDQEANVRAKDDVNDVMAIRFALLDAARDEVECLLESAS